MKKIHDGSNDPTKEQVVEAFFEASNTGNLDVIKDLLTLPGNKYQRFLFFLINPCFLHACMYGQINIVKYLLTSSDIKTHAEINTDNDDGFISACGAGHLDVVKYLLSSSDLKNHSNINASSNKAFSSSAGFGHLNVIKYLFSMPKIKENIITKEECSNLAFSVACIKNQLHILQYIILELNIDKSPMVEILMKNTNNTEALKIFELRDLKTNIENELNVSNTTTISTKKIKI